MNKEFLKEINFTQALLNNMNISSHICVEPNTYISPDIDMGLRKLLYNIDNYLDILANSMKQAESNTIYRFFDEYQCNYVFFRIPECKKDSYLYIGPYLTVAPSEEMLSSLFHRLDISETLKKQVTKYYFNLPIIEDDTLILTIIKTLANVLWCSPEHYSIDFIEYMIPDRTAPICVSPVMDEPYEHTFSLAVLEENYANERILMESISQGKLQNINAIASTVYSNGTEPRLSDSLRNRKNYLIILNTLLRKAAEQGGVHPLHLDRISSKFAKEIEQISSINQSLQLQTNMMRKYCLLVRQHSLSKYSFLVGKVITIITADLTADLSLKALSTQLNVTPGYLSSLFHKECGTTLTDYVTEQRINYALSLLNQTDLSIQTISAHCGIPDTNYFIKLFKKQVGITPSQYRKQLKG